MDKINVPELEMKILKLMWDLKDPAAVQDIIDNWDEPKPGYTTILKKLQVMEKKELVDHVKEGRSYRYFTLIQKSQVTATKFKSLLSDLFGGNKMEMAAAFVKDTGMTKEEISSLLESFMKEDGDE